MNSYFNRFSDGFQLFSSLKRFTILAFSDFISRTEARQLTSLANDILQQYSAFALQIGFKNEIFCKLHHLTHYGQLVEKFGPLYQFGTFRYERKHMVSKAWARVMRSFVNTSKTIHGNHQILRAIILEESSFKTTNFWDNQNEDRTILLNALPSGECFSKVKCNDRPYQLNKNVIRKLVSRNNFWFFTEEFYTSENSSVVYCKGQVVSLDQAAQQQSTDLSLPRVKLNSQKQFILLTNLHYSNDFLYYLNGFHYLLKWI